MILGTIKKKDSIKGEKRGGLWSFWTTKALPRPQSLAITFWGIFELVERLRVTFKANGKRQIQVESFSE